MYNLNSLIEVLDKNLLPDISKIVLPDPSMREHIPISCHYNPDTLITKNSDLVQIIEVSGFADAAIDAEHFEDMRDAVKDAIHKSIPSLEYSVYIHTIRSRKNIMPPQGQLPYGIANDLNDAWRKKNNWDKQLTNTLYISIVRQGIDATLTNTKTFAASFFPGLLKKQHIQFFEKASIELTMICNNIISRLKNFGARKLNLLRTNKGYISEPLFFYYNLVHLSQKRTPLPVRDLSNYLSSCRMLLHFNSIEIKNDSDETRHAAIFSVKEQPELSHDLLDQLLQLGTEFIISQAIIFVDKNEAQAKYNEANRIFKTSKSENLSEISGVKGMLEADTGKPSDYCKQQTTITIFSDTQEFFQKRLKEVVHTLHELGIVVVREDYFMPKLFWSQLPGNFKYLSRFNYKCHKNIAEFSCIHSLKSGNFKGSKWGPPVTLIRQLDGSTYYFNFHNSLGNGHTLLVGPTQSGKTALQRFFLSQSTRYSPRLIIIDVENKTDAFAKSLGGIYTDISTWNKPLFRLNPFDPKVFDGNLDLLGLWLMHSIFPRGETIDEYKEFFKVLAVKLSETPDSENKLALIESIINSSEDVALIEGFKSFLGNPEIFNKYFTTGEDETAYWDLDNIMCLNVSSLKTAPIHFQAYVGVLLQKLVNSLDGKPTIISLNRLSMLYDIPWFKDLIPNWLDKLQKKNTIAFLTTEKNVTTKNVTFLSEQTRLFGTHIFISDKFADKYFRRSYNLTENELYKIKSHDLSKRMFLLKQDNRSLVMSLDLSGFPDQLKILTT